MMMTLCLNAIVMSFVTAAESGLLPLVVIIDDRTEVWESVSQAHILQVSWCCLIIT